MRPLLLAVAVLAAPGCSPGPVAQPPAEAGWAVGEVALAASADGQAQLEAVRAARHAEFDRVAFEFDALRPGVDVAYVDRPLRACGSGEAIYPPGDGYLEVRFESARAHDEMGRPRAAPSRRALDLPNAIALIQTCDFEGVVTWVVALESPEPFRVVPLDGPPRLAVDVRHPTR